MTSFDDLSLWILGSSAVCALTFLCIGRGFSASVVFFYLASYQIMELILIWLGQLTDVPYISLSLAINSFFFYIFLNSGCRWAALVVGFDTIYAFSNIWLIQSGVLALDTFYGHVGVAVSLLLLIDGVGRGVRYKHAADGDSWSGRIQSLLRALSFGKGAKE